MSILHLLKIAESASNQSLMRGSILKMGGPAAF